MAQLEVGKIYVPRNSDELRDDFLTDIRLELLAQGVAQPPVEPNSDWYVLGTALGNLSLLEFSNIEIASNDGNVLTAGGERLRELRDAYGLPEVTPSPSFGPLKISMPAAATSTIVAGTQYVLPNGLRGQVTQTYVGVVDGDIVDTVTIDSGSATELDAGKKVRFVNPPLNVNTEATVEPPGLRGGADEESDDRLRVRILNRLQNPPAGGSWSDIREKALNSLASISDCFVYPALGGPGSVKVVPVKPFDIANNNFSRTPTSGQLGVVENALHTYLPSPMEVVVQGPVPDSYNVALHITIPESSLAGGNGKGWMDATIWPALVGGDGGRVTVTTVTTTSQITVAAGTAVSPVAGQTRIMWWSKVDRKFRTYLVTAVSGTAGAWVLTLDAPLVDSTGASVAAGDFISPGAVNSEKYATTWVDLFTKFGPGQNTSDANRVPRALRHPYVTSESPATMTVLSLAAFIAKNDEVSDAEFGYTASEFSPIVTGVNDAPLILVPYHFGVYKK